MHRWRRADEPRRVRCEHLQTVQSSARPSRAALPVLPATAHRCRRRLSGAVDGEAFGPVLRSSALIGPHRSRARPCRPRGSHRLCRRYRSGAHAPITGAGSQPASVCARSEPSRRPPPSTRTSTIADRELQAALPTVWGSPTRRCVNSAAMRAHLIDARRRRPRHSNDLRRALERHRPPRQQD